MSRQPGRIILVVMLTYVGLCEALATTAAIDWDLVPDWLALLIIPVGFVAVLLLGSFLGNALVAVGSLIIPWQAWRWPFWKAALLAAPFWIVTYRLSPKPW